MKKREQKTRRAILLKMLRESRLEAGLRQVDLAKRLHQHQSFISKYESGERRLDLLELREVCEAMGISLQDFIARLEKNINET